MALAVVFCPVGAESGSSIGSFLGPGDAIGSGIFAEGVLEFGRWFGCGGGSGFCRAFGGSRGERLADLAEIVRGDDVVGQQPEQGVDELARVFPAVFPAGE